MKDLATTITEHCHLVGNVSEERGPIVRPYGSRAMNEANDTVAGPSAGRK